MIEADHVTISSINQRSACDSRTGLVAAGQSLHRIGSDKGYIDCSAIVQESTSNYGDVLACAGFSNGCDDGFAAIFLPRESGSVPQLRWFGVDGIESPEDSAALLPPERFSSILVLAVAPIGNLALIVGSDGEPFAYARGESQATTPPPLWLPIRPSPSPVLALSFELNGGKFRIGHWTALGTLNGTLCLAHSTTEGSEVKTLTTQFDGPISALLLHASSDHSNASHAVVGGAQGWVAIVRLPGDSTMLNSSGSSESTVVSSHGYDESTSSELAIELVHRDLGAAVTALTLHDVQLAGRLEVIAGTASGRVVALDVGTALGKEAPTLKSESNASPVDSSAGKDRRSHNLFSDKSINTAMVWERDTLQPVHGLASLGCSPSHGLPEIMLITADGASLYAPAPSVVAKKVAVVAELAERLTSLRQEARGRI